VPQCNDGASERGFASQVRLRVILTYPASEPGVRHREARRRRSSSDSAAPQKERSAWQRRSGGRARQSGKVAGMSAPRKSSSSLTPAAAATHSTSTGPRLLSTCAQCRPG